MPVEFLNVYKTSHDIKDRTEHSSSEAIKSNWKLQKQKKLLISTKKCNIL